MATQNITIHALAGTYVLAFAPHVVTYVPSLVED